MCGILGYYGTRKIEPERITGCQKLMRLRGPDFTDVVHYLDAFDRNVYFIHSRLSIIDLEARSNQPFSVDGCTLIYNGEIYNYVELRKNLENQGIHFKTTSDTEVLLQAYLQYGDECVQYFEGMWAFAIYDSRNGKLFMSRDRFSEKPLYYLKTQDGFYFGSEVKFIKALWDKPLTVNINHIFRYLVNGYKSLYKTSDTFFNEIKEVPYATNLFVNPDLEIKTHRYWIPKYTPQKMPLQEAIEGTRYWLKESMKIRLRADVPLAFCLSGGIDSASLVSMSAKEFGYDVATFSIIERDDRYNECENIMATIDDLGCKHNLIHIQKNNFFDRLKGLVQYHDAPVSTISYYIHSFLSEAIAMTGYRVAVSGTAADELFTGYYDHFNLHLYEMRDHPHFADYLNDWEKHIHPIVRNPYLQDPELYFKNPHMRDHIYLNNDIFQSFLKVEFHEVFTEKLYADSLLRNRMLNELFHESTPVILHEDDLNSMYYSIENRSPFLDSRLFQFAYSIPMEHLIRDCYGKYVLREAMKGILNEKVRTDRRKKGFNASIHSLMDFEKKETKDYLLSQSPVYDFIKKEKIEEVMTMKSMPNSYSKFFFNFVNAKIFLEVN